MPVWYREWEKEHAQLWEAITGQISPKVLTPAPKLIAVFWRWIKAFVLWLSKLERSLPAGLNQHSISPQQRLPACLMDFASKEPQSLTGNRMPAHTHLYTCPVEKRSPTPGFLRAAQVICKMQKQIQACHFSNSRSNNRTPGTHEKVCVKWRRSWRAVNEAVSGSPW